MDRAFTEVVACCAGRHLRPEGTWISPEMQSAYLALHGLGYAHSVETWLDGRLVGGLYGVGLGQVFFGESMFSVERDASKVALKRLVDEAVVRGTELIDCQVTSPHLESMGARRVSRATFSAVLSRAIPAAATPRAWT
jgi:leucyl/phenylalanyl-tRNA--protein transferase